MDLAKKVLESADDFPIKSVAPPKVGKVRCVYDLGDDRLAMIITDRISAFDVPWHTENNVWGIERKGLCLNKQTRFWFEKFQEQGLGKNHIIEEIHPYVWICSKAEPIMVEAIYRNYITGSMWRDYEKGDLDFCGNQLPEGLKKNDALPEPIFTPTTKGILKIEGIPEEDDAKITYQQIQEKWKEFGFKSLEDVEKMRDLGFEANNFMRATTVGIKAILVDDKKEMGYINGELCWIDEQGTQDSSRFWDLNEYEKEGKAVEESKEFFRGHLLAQPFKEELTKKKRDMSLVRGIAIGYSVPDAVWGYTSQIYQDFTERLVGKEILYETDNIRADILDALSDKGLLK